VIASPTGFVLEHWTPTAQGHIHLMCFTLIQGHSCVHPIVMVARVRHRLERPLLPAGERAQLHDLNARDTRLHGRESLSRVTRVPGAPRLVVPWPADGKCCPATSYLPIGNECDSLLTSGRKAESFATSSSVSIVYGFRQAPPNEKWAKILA